MLTPVDCVGLLTTTAVTTTPTTAATAAAAAPTIITFCGVATAATTMALAKREI